MPLTTHSIGILISRIFGLYILISMLGYIQPSTLFPIWLTVLALVLSVSGTAHLRILVERHKSV